MKTSLKWNKFYLYSWIGNFTKEGHNICTHISTHLEYYLYNHYCILLPYACSKPCFNRGGFYQWLLNSLKVRATPALMSEMRNKSFIFWQACKEYNGQLATFHMCISQLSHGTLTWRFEQKLFNLGVECSSSRLQSAFYTMYIYYSKVYPKSTQVIQSCPLHLAPMEMDPWPFRPCFTSKQLRSYVTNGIFSGQRIESSLETQLGGDPKHVGWIAIPKKHLAPWG